MIISTLDNLLNNAIQLGASDLHFEPHKEGALIRARIDGILQPALTTGKEILIPLISRIKVLAHLDLAEKRLPQDGRIFLEINQQKIDLRISTIPTIYGEKVVVRILNKNTAIKTLAALKMPAPELERFGRLLNKKHGMILVAGPTGSGKTTTLYAALQKLNQPTVNIITIEDPVEYSLEGINQIHVNEKIGMTFERGLRAILRQDPDIIMVGEIRDRETARVAITAALTGHLVLSTIHTHDCLSTISRLTDMGIEPYLLGGSLVGMIAQRLARKIGGGRQAIFEVLVIDSALRRQISTGAAFEQIKSSITQNNLTTLHENGTKLVNQQIISPSELSRVMSE